MDSKEGADLNSSPITKRQFNEGEGDQDPNERQPLNDGGSRVHTHDSIIFKLLMHYSNAGVRWARRLLMDAPRLLSELRIQDSIKEIKTLLRNHPVAAIIFTIMTIACGIPILIFVAFAVITIFFTFGGFLVIEGAVLVAGSFALLLCLSTMVITFISISFLGGLLYVTYLQVENMVRVNMTSGEQLQPFDSRLPQVLASLRNAPYTNRPSRGRTTHSPQSSNFSNGHVHLHNSK